MTSGPLLLLKIGEHSVGDVIPISQPTEYRVTLEAWPSGAVAGEHLTRVELIRNGEVIKRFEVNGRERRFAAEFKIHEKQTAWYLARCFGSSELQVAVTNPIYFEGSDYHPPQPTLARVIGIVTDRSTGEPLAGDCEITRMVGLTPVRISSHQFKDGRFRLEAPGTARLRVDVPGYKPMMKSIFMDYAPLLQMMLNMREAELTDWRTFEEISDLLGSVRLDFQLEPSKSAP